MSSEASLAEMCKQAKIVLNCVGPVCTLFSVVKRSMLIISVSQKKKLKDPVSQKKVIRITYPCVYYPLAPYFYIVKQGFTGVYIIFLFLLQNIDCGYSLEPPH